MSSKAHNLVIILKLIRNGSKVLYKLAKRLVFKGFISRKQIEAHDETRKIVGMQPKWKVGWKPGDAPEGPANPDRGSHTKRPHVVKRGGKLL
jgi:hypothetical protein